MTGPLRWGFKKEAEEIAEEVRCELALAPTAPLDPRRFAAYLEIPLWELGTLREVCPNAVKQFTQIDQGAFSAATVFHGRSRVIVHNESHSSGRQASNLAHELAHALLQHPPTPALNDLGCREWDRTLEDEAAWLGAALLIPARAALGIARKELDDQTAADLFGVSIQMVRFRMNTTAARRRILRNGSSVPNTR